MTHSSMTDTSMTEALGRFLDVDTARYKLISINLANIDTPGYKTRDLNFRAELQRAAAEAAARDTGFAAGQLVADAIPHQIRGLMERPDGNNVSVERETLLLAEAQMKFNLGIQLLKDQFHTISLAINSGGTSS